MSVVMGTLKPLNINKISAIYLPRIFLQIFTKVFLDHQKQEHMYQNCVLSYNMNPDKLAPLRTSWCTLLKVAINQEAWKGVLLLPPRISICNI